LRLAIAGEPAGAPPPAFPFPKITMSKSVPRFGRPQKASRRAHKRSSRSPALAGRNQFQVPAGRRGFYARLFPVSTTFSRKIRFFQLFKKHLKNQRFVCTPKRLYSPHSPFRYRNTQKLAIPQSGFKHFRMRGGG
jgi:hypothetical protein